jgi:hypothetical protein
VAGVVLVEVSTVTVIVAPCFAVFEQRSSRNPSSRRYSLPRGFSNGITCLFRLEVRNSMCSRALLRELKERRILSSRTCVLLNKPSPICHELSEAQIPGNVANVVRHSGNSQAKGLLHTSLWQSHRLLDQKPVASAESAIHSEHAAGRWPATAERSRR